MVKFKFEREIVLIFCLNRKRNICKKMSFEINNKWGMVDLILGDVYVDYRSLVW